MYDTNQKNFDKTNFRKTTETLEEAESKLTPEGKAFLKKFGVTEKEMRDGFKVEVPDVKPPTQAAKVAEPTTVKTKVVELKTVKAKDAKPLDQDKSSFTPQNAYLRKFGVTGKETKPPG